MVVTPPAEGGMSGVNWSVRAFCLRLAGQL